MNLSDLTPLQPKNQSRPLGLGIGYRKFPGPAAAALGPESHRLSRRGAAGPLPRPAGLLRAARVWAGGLGEDVAVGGGGLGDLAGEEEPAEVVREEAGVGPGEGGVVGLYVGRDGGFSGALLLGE